MNHWSEDASLADVDQVGRDVECEIGRAVGLNSELDWNHELRVDYDLQLLRGPIGVERLRAEGVDGRRRGKDCRSREESDELRTELASKPSTPHLSATLDTRRAF